jgi:hypothetical protein
MLLVRGSIFFVGGVGGVRHQTASLMMILNLKYCLIQNYN